MISAFKVQAEPIKPEDVPDYDPAKHFWVIACEDEHSAIQQTCAQIDLKRYEGWAFSAAKIGEI